MDNVGKAHDLANDFLYGDADLRTRLFFLTCPEELSFDQWTDLLAYCFNHRKLLRFAKTRFDRLVALLSDGSIPALKKLDSAHWRHQEFVEAWVDFLLELQRRPYKSERSSKYRPSNCLTSLWILNQFVYFVRNWLRNPTWRREQTLAHDDEHPFSKEDGQVNGLLTFQLKDFRRRLQEAMPEFWYSTWTSFLMVSIDERDVIESSWIMGLTIAEGIELQARLCHRLREQFPSLNRPEADRIDVLAIDITHAESVLAFTLLRMQCEPSEFEMALLLSPPLLQVQAQHVLGVSTGTLKKRFFSLREKHLKPAALCWQEAHGSPDNHG